MRIGVSDAKARLTDLVRRAEAGEEVILTRNGRPVVRLAPAGETLAPGAFREALAEIQASAARKVRPGADAAGSQDFLYDEDGLPG